jgi:hypothetical protein
MAPCQMRFWTLKPCFSAGCIRRLRRRDYQLSHDGFDATEYSVLRRDFASRVRSRIHYQIQVSAKRECGGVAPACEDSRNPGKFWEPAGDDCTQLLGNAATLMAGQLWGGSTEYGVRTVPQTASASAWLHGTASGMGRPDRPSQNPRLHENLRLS